MLVLNFLDVVMPTVVLAEMENPETVTRVLCLTLSQMVYIAPLLLTLASGDSAPSGSRWASGWCGCWFWFPAGPCCIRCFSNPSQRKAEGALPPAFPWLGRAFRRASIFRLAPARKAAGMFRSLSSGSFRAGRTGRTKTGSGSDLIRIPPYGDVDSFLYIEGRAEIRNRPSEKSRRPGRAACPAAAAGRLSPGHASAVFYPASAVLFPFLSPLKAPYRFGRQNHDPTWSRKHSGSPIPFRKRENHSFS